jgi:hypothetical protein
MDIVKRARDYLALNAAESGADILIEEMADEIEQLREVLDDALSWLAADDVAFPDWWEKGAALRNRK